jgi:hypothetical protein
MNMKWITLVLVTATALMGCSVGILGNGSITTESRTVTDFSALDANGGFEIQWTKGQPSLSITTDQNLLTNIQTVVDKDTLRISSDEPLRPTKGVKIVLSSSGIKKVDLTGAIRFTGKSITGEKLSISSSGAVTADVAGEAGQLTVNLTGASSLKASSLKAKSATISLTGASNGEVAVSEHLKASITGAGSLSYTGNPRVEQRVTGVGTIRQRK